MLIPRALEFALCVFVLSVTSAVAADGPTGGIVAGANISSARLAGIDASGISAGNQAGLFVGADDLERQTGAVSVCRWLKVHRRIAIRGWS